MDVKELEDSLAAYARETRQARQQKERDIQDDRQRERRALAALRAFNPDHSLLKRNGGPPKKPAAANQAQWVSVETMDKVASLFLDNPADDFSTPEIVEKTGLRHESVRRTLFLLRDAEGILFTGSRTRPNTAGHKKTEHFKLGDREGIEEVLKRNKERAHA